MQTTKSSFTPSFQKGFPMSAKNLLSLSGNVVDLRTVDTELPLVEEFMQVYEKDKEIVDALTSNNSLGVSMDDGSVKEFNEDYRTPAYEIHKDLILGVYTKDTNLLIGVVVFHHTNRVIDRTGLVGVYISNKSRSKEYRSEAMKLLLEHVFTTTQMRKVEAIYIGQNDRIRKYLEKCGFKLEAILQEHVLGENEKKFDVGVLAIFKDAFQKQ